MTPVHLTLFACAVAAAVLVVRYDLYEREPWFMLVVAAAAGGALMWVIGHVEDFSLARMGGSDSGPLVLAAIAASHEELARVLVVAAIAIVLPSQLNDPIDGLIYGSIVGLGMAVEESRALLVLIGADGWAIPATEPVRLLGHLVLGGIGGFAVGMARMGMRGWPLMIAAGLAASTGIHFLWDWIAFVAAERRIMTSSQTASAIALMLAGMATYGSMVVVGSRWSRRVFAPGSRHSLWGWPFGSEPGSTRQ